MTWQRLWYWLTVPWRCVICDAWSGNSVLCPRCRHKLYDPPWEGQP